MLNIAMDRDWSDWQLVQTGSGVVSIDNGVLTIDGEVGSSAYLRYTWRSTRMKGLFLSVMD